MHLLNPQGTCTAEDLLTMPDGDQYELVDGKLVETDMGTESSFVGGHLCRLLGNHCDSPARGWVFPGDTSYQCFPGRPNLSCGSHLLLLRRPRLALRSARFTPCRIGSRWTAPTVRRGC